MPIRTCADTDSTLALSRVRSGSVVFEGRDRIEDDAGLLDVAVPQCEELGQLVGSRGGQIVDLARVG